MKYFKWLGGYKGNPPYCKIKDLGRDILIDLFYEKKLQKIFKYNDVFRIETTIKKCRGEKGVKYLVKWFGYPPSFNSRVKEKDLQDV